MATIQLLESAIKAGDEGQARSLLVADANLAEQPTSMGVSPLLLAVYFGQQSIAAAIAQHKVLDIFESAALGDVTRTSELLARDQGAINAVSPDGFTPLGYAAYFGQLAVAEALLAKKAMPNIASNNGLAVTPLHSAMSGGHKEIASLLIAEGADVNAASGEGWTPLHYAAHNGDTGMILKLRDLGAKSKPNRDGKTPFDLAMENGQADAAAILAD